VCGFEEPTSEVETGLTVEVVGKASEFDCRSVDAVDWMLCLDGFGCFSKLACCGTLLLEEDSVDIRGEEALGIRVGLAEACLPGDLRALLFEDCCTPFF